MRGTFAVGRLPLYISGLAPERALSRGRQGRRGEGNADGSTDQRQGCLALVEERAKADEDLVQRLAIDSTKQPRMTCGQVKGANLLHDDASSGRGVLGQLLMQEEGPLTAADGADDGHAA